MIRHSSTLKTQCDDFIKVIGSANDVLRHEAVTNIHFPSPASALCVQHV